MLAHRQFMQDYALVPHENYLNCSQCDHSHQNSRQELGHPSYVEASNKQVPRQHYYIPLDTRNSRTIYEQDKVARSSQRLSSKTLIGQPLSRAQNAEATYISSNASSVRNLAENQQTGERKEEPRFQTVNDEYLYD